MSILKDQFSNSIVKNKNILEDFNNLFASDVPFDHDLSTFTTTDIPDELKKLMLNFAELNIAISPKAFPSINKMEKECLDFIANLFNAPNDKYFGIATVGSSEACILSAISMLFNWQAHNNNGNNKPNLIISNAYQICWKKFCKMFNVELRTINTRDDCTIIEEELERAVDKNTIGIVALFANTLTGRYDNIEKINQIIENIKNTKKLNIPFHIDAASGGFYSPFITPDLLFDFRLNNVTSISVSGHKFGLVPPSIGWLIFRDNKILNSSLKNELDYLGGGILKDIGINFSKSGMPLIAQYLLIKSLGFDGYKKVITNINNTSNYLENCLKKIPNLNIITKGDISTVIYNVKNIDMYKLEILLREKYHWQVPTYELPNTNEVCQRIVVRSDFTTELADNFVSDLKSALQEL